jgi:hypothetical protein
VATVQVFTETFIMNNNKILKLHTAETIAFFFHLLPLKQTITYHGSVLFDALVTVALHNKTGGSKCDHHPESQKNTI